MSRVFYLSMAAGAAVTLLVAVFFPLPRHERVRSLTEVIADGGRAETFVVRWPEDRLGLPPPPGVGAAAGGALIRDGGNPASVEVFRLRDAQGNVVGIASRTTALRRQAASLVQGSDWLLLLPGRGALLLTVTNARDVAPAASSSGGQPIPAVDRPDFWRDGRRLLVSAGPLDGSFGAIMGGSREFAGLAGSFQETWELESVTAGAATRGRIVIETRLQAVAR